MKKLFVSIALVLSSIGAFAAPPTMPMNPNSGPPYAVTKEGNAGGTAAVLGAAIAIGAGIAWHAVAPAAVPVGMAAATAGGIAASTVVGLGVGGALVGYGLYKWAQPEEKVVISPTRPMAMTTDYRY